MADATFTCKECHEEGPYYETRKRLDPRMRRRARVICADCWDKLKRSKGRK